MTYSVLIVEDDPDDVYLTSRALDTTGFDLKLESAENGLKMLDLLNSKINSARDTLPHLILLDLNMPEMDGLTALYHLREIDFPRRIPTIVFTTSNSSYDIKDSYRAGADDFLTKPANFAALSESLTEVCSKWLV